MRETPVHEGDDQDETAHRKSAGLSRSTIDTSPLSSSLSLSEMQTVEGEEAVAHASTQHDTERAPDLAQDEAPGDEVDTTLEDDELSTTELDYSFHCPHCNAPYATKVQLKKHLSGGRSKCYRDRNAEWSCPRCHENFTAKKGVLRHMQVTCWKTCDECCATGIKNCDANDRESEQGCTNCVSAGKTCSSHTAAVATWPSPQKNVAGAGPDHTVAPLTAAPPNITRPPQRGVGRKRNASASPENSPESKPKPKRKRGRPSKRSVVAAQDKDSLNLRDGDKLHAASPALPKRRGRPSKRPVIPSDDEDSLGDELFGPEGPAPGQARQALHQALSEVRTESHQREATTNFRLPRGATAADKSRLPVPIGALSTLAGMPRQPPLSVLPPMDGRNIQGIVDGTRHAPTAQEQIERRKQLQARGQPAQYDRDTQELLDRQRQSAQNIALMQQHMAVHNGGALPAPVMSSTRSSLHMGQNAFNLVPPGGRRSGLRNEFHIHEDPVSAHFNAPGVPAFGFSNPGSRVPSRASSVVQGHLSAPGSRMPSRQPSPSHLDVTLAGIGSRFPSRAASPNLRRSSLHHASADNGMHDHEHANSERAEQVAIPREVPSELNQELSIPPTLTSQPSDRSNPTIRLRISSNTHDPTGTLIFSILTLRTHDLFGPRLEYYCTQRSKRLNIDWKIIYKYPAPTPSKPERMRYFDLNYDTTPHMCFDKEYPGQRMRDGDTLVVCRPRTGIVVDDGVENELGTQLDVERIEIENGERPTFQGEEVNVKWYRDVDAQVASWKQQAAAMYEMAKRYADAFTESRNATHNLQKENEELRNRVGGVQQSAYAQVPHAERMWEAPAMRGGQQAAYQYQRQRQRHGGAGFSGQGMPDTPTPQQRGRPYPYPIGEGESMHNQRGYRSSLARQFVMGGEDEEE